MTDLYDVCLTARTPTPTSTSTSTLASTSTLTSTLYLGPTPLTWRGLERDETNDDADADADGDGEEEMNGVSSLGCALTPVVRRAGASPVVSGRCFSVSRLLEADRHSGLIALAVSSSTSPSPSPPSTATTVVGHKLAANAMATVSPQSAGHRSAAVSRSGSTNCEYLLCSSERHRTIRQPILCLAICITCGAISSLDSQNNDISSSM